MREPPTGTSSPKQKHPIPSACPWKRKNSRGTISRENVGWRFSKKKKKKEKIRKKSFWVEDIFSSSEVLGYYMHIQRYTRTCRPLRFIYKTWFTFHFQASSRVKVNIQGPTRIIYSCEEGFAQLRLLGGSPPPPIHWRRGQIGGSNIFLHAGKRKRKNKKISTCVLSTHVLGSPLKFFHTFSVSRKVAWKIVKKKSKNWFGFFVGVWKEISFSLSNFLTTW